MKVAAREKAASLCWGKYRERLVTLAQEVVGRGVES